MSANPRLGRGLAALMGDGAPPAEGAHTAIRTLLVAQLEPGPYQPRSNFSDESMAELVASIKAHGVLQPLLVRLGLVDAGVGKPQRYEIVAGERRWRAAQQAGLHEVPVIVRMMTAQDALAAALVENLQRQDLDAIEEGEGFHRLQEEFGMTQEQLATAVGKSRSHVANVMRLLGLPPSVREHVQKGTLTAGHARALLMHADPEAAARLVIARGLNVRQTEALASSKPPAEKRVMAEKDPETASLERDLSERLGLTVRIDFDGKGGEVKIQYRSLDQLDGLLALLNR